MRASDEERREVARKLRDSMFNAGVKFKCGDTSWSKLYRTLFGGYMDSNQANVTYNKVVQKLAELIEPEPEQICEDISTEYGKFECSNCGCRITDTTCVENGGVYFCPDCGKAVENAD